MAINAHLSQIMPPLLVMASRDDNAPGPVAAREAVQKIVSAVAEDGLYLLISQVWQASRSKGLPVLGCFMDCVAQC